MFGQQGQVERQVQELLVTAGSQQSQGHVFAAMNALQQAKQRAQEGGGPALTAQVMAATASLHMAAGHGDDALTAMQEASDLFGQAGDQPSRVRALVQLASMRAAAGQANAALGLVRDCLAAASRLGDKQLITEVRAANGQLLLGTGNIPGAVDEFRAGLQTAAGLSDPIAQIQLRAFLAVAVFQSGDVVQANKLLTENARVARDMPNLVAAARALSIVCDALLAIRRPLDALNVGQEILAKLQSAGAKPQIIDATIALANLYALAGRPDDSAKCAKQAVAAARETGGPAAAIPVLMRLGTMALQRGDRQAATDFLGQAKKQVTAAGLPTPPVLIQMLGQLGQLGL